MIKMFCLRVKSTASPQLRDRFNVPFYAKTEQDAIAYLVGITKRAKEENIDINMSLFSLYWVGIFDDLKGIIKKKPKFISHVDEIPDIIDILKGE